MKGQRRRQKLHAVAEWAHSWWCIVYAGAVTGDSVGVEDREEHLFQFGASVASWLIVIFFDHWKHSLRQLRGASPCTPTQLHAPFRGTNTCNLQQVLVQTVTLGTASVGYYVSATVQRFFLSEWVWNTVCLYTNHHTHDSGQNYENVLLQKINM